MEPLVSTIKEHKGAFLALAAAIVIFLVLRSRSSAASQSSPLNSILAYNEQQNQLNAQVAAQQSTVNAQSGAQEASYAAANYQTAQAAQSANEQTEAELLSNLYDTQQSAGATNAQTAAELAALENSNGTESEIAGLQANIYDTQIGASTAVAEQDATLQAAQNKQILSEVGAAGLNHGTSSLENDLAAIIAEVEGQPNAASSAFNANAINSEASAATTNSMWGAISRLGNTAISGFLA